MAVCSWGSERSRFVVFAILGLRCTDCSTAVFFLATDNFFHENSHVAFFLVGHGTGTQFRVLPRRGRRSRDPTYLISAKLSGRVYRQVTLKRFRSNRPKSAGCQSHRPVSGCDRSCGPARFRHTCQARKSARTHT